MVHRIIHRLGFSKKLMVVAAAFAAGAGPVVLGIASAPRLGGQTAAPVAFEVASVKPFILPAGVVVISKLYPPAVPFRISGSYVTASRITVTELIRAAYDVKEFQITGEPRKVFPTGDRYDIKAKASGDAAPTVEQVRLMFQSLLADRFQLKLHPESKQLPVYHLVIGKSGSKLKPVPPDAAPSKGQSIDQLIEALSRGLDRPILDKTGLSGKFEYTMEWGRLTQARLDDPDGFAIGALSSAVQENFGLKLESAKDQVEILVIDHVEKPSEN
jgi:bla regulator protein BlaR1